MKITLPKYEKKQDVLFGDNKATIRNMQFDSENNLWRYEIENKLIKFRAWVKEFEITKKIS